MSSRQLSPVTSIDSDPPNSDYSFLADKAIITTNSPIHLSLTPRSFHRLGEARVYTLRPPPGGLRALQPSYTRSRVVVQARPKVDSSRVARVCLMSCSVNGAELLITALSVILSGMLVEREYLAAFIQVVGAIDWVCGPGLVY